MYHWLFSGIFGKDAADVMVTQLSSLINKQTGAGLTEADKQKAALEDEYLDDNRIQDYLITKRGWDEMYSPEATMVSQSRGLEKVGINKMALAGGVTSGASASTPSPSFPSVGSSNGESISSLLSSLSGIGFKKKELDIARSRADAQNKVDEAIAEGKRIENTWKDRRERAEYYKTLAESKNIEQNTAKLVEDTKYAQTLAIFAPDLISSKVQEQMSSSARNNAEAALADKKVELTDKEIENLDEVIKNHRKERDVMDAKIAEAYQNCLALASSAYRDDAAAENLYKQNEKLNAEIREIGVSIGLKEKDIQYYIWNHAREYGAFGVRWPVGSENGNNAAVVGDMSDLQLMSALRDRGIISEQQFNSWYMNKTD